MTGDQPLAVLDVGSNTIRLLVARPESEALEPLLDASEFVRLGKGVDGTGRLQPEREEAALSAIAQLGEQARKAGAQDIYGIATSAVRDAQNGREFVDTVRERTGVAVEIISGEREAYLTYLGATLGLPGTRPSIVCDLGGGSAELIAANGRVQWARSVQLGSGRLSERFIHHDPPTEEDLGALEWYVRGLLASLPPVRAERAVLTGGTATHVALLAGKPGTVIHLTPGEMEAVLRTLETLPASEVVDRFGIRPERAQVLPAGTQTLLAIAGFYGVRDIIVTRHGIREGAILDRMQRQSSRSSRR